MEEIDEYVKTKVKSGDEYVRKLVGYDRKAADALVGTTIDLDARGVYVIKAHVHFHFFMVRQDPDDGWFTMEHAREILDIVAKQNAKKGFMKNGDPLGKIFQEKGFYMDHSTSSGQEFAIDGTVASMFGKNDSGCSIDHATVMASLNNVDGYFEIGAGGRVYSYCHTFKPDKEKACGYTVISSGDDILLDEKDWKPIEKLPDSLVAFAKRQLDKSVPMIGKTFLTKDDKNGNIVFWEKDSDTAYRFLIEPRADATWEKKIWMLQIGTVKKKPTKTESGKAANGRRASWGDSWSLYKDATPIDGAIIRDRIMALVDPAIREIAKRRKHE